jgi:hypothetical protein
MDEHRDRLADKLADLNHRLWIRHEMREGLNELVRRGELAYDPDTDEYTLLSEGEEAGGEGSLQSGG